MKVYLVSLILTLFSAQAHAGIDIECMRKTVASVFQAFTKKQQSSYFPDSWRTQFDLGMLKTKEGYVFRRLIGPENADSIIFREYEEKLEHSLHLIGLRREWESENSNRSAFISSIDPKQRQAFYDNITSHAQLVFSHWEGKEYQLPFELDVDPKWLKDGKLAGLRDDYDQVIELSRVFHHPDMSELDGQAAHIKIFQWIQWFGDEHPGKTKLVISAHSDWHRDFWSKFGFSVKRTLTSTAGEPIYLLEATPESIRHAMNVRSVSILNEFLEHRRGQFERNEIRRPQAPVDRVFFLHPSQTSDIVGRIQSDPGSGKRGLFLEKSTIQNGQRVVLDTAEASGTYRILPERVTLKRMYDKHPVSARVLEVTIRARFPGSSSGDYVAKLRVPVFDGTIRVTRSHVNSRQSMENYASYVLLSDSYPSSPQANYQVRRTTGRTKGIVTREQIDIPVHHFILFPELFPESGFLAQFDEWGWKPSFQGRGWYPREQGLSVDGLHRSLTQAADSTPNNTGLPLLDGMQSVQEVLRIADEQVDFEQVFSSLGFEKIP